MRPVGWALKSTAWLIAWAPTKPVSNADFRRFLHEAKDPPAMRDLLREMSAKVGL